MKGKICSATMILAVSASIPVCAQAGAIVVAQSSAISSVDTEEVRKIFLGRESMVSGQPVTVVYQGEDAARTDFETRVLGKTGADLNSHWARLIFTGKAVAPIEAIGDTGVKSKIISTPGAIGYISDAAIDSSLKMLMKY